MRTHEQISRARRDELLAGLESSEIKLVARRVDIVHEIRTLSTELESIDQQLMDIALNEEWLMGM